MRGVFVAADGLPERARRNKELMAAERARRADTEAARQLSEKQRERAERARREDEKLKKALDEGRGVLGVITDQIWDVWNQKGDDVKPKEEASRGDEAQATSRKQE